MQAQQRQTQYIAFFSFIPVFTYFVEVLCKRALHLKQNNTALLFTIRSYIKTLYYVNVVVKTRLLPFVWYFVPHNKWNPAYIILHDKKQV